MPNPASEETTEKRVSSSPSSLEQTYSYFRKPFSAGSPLTDAVERRVENSSWTVDSVMAPYSKKKSVYCWRAYATHCGLGGFHTINPESLWVSRRMGVRNRLRVQRNDFGRKSLKIHRGPLIQTTGLTAAQKVTATSRVV